MIFNKGGDFKGSENRIGYPVGEGVAENAVRRLERGEGFPLLPHYLPTTYTTVKVFLQL